MNMKLNLTNLVNYFNKKRLKNKSFCIISNDCWGGELYSYFNVKYNTPFIGLYIMAPCYIKLLQNFNDYMKLNLEFIEKSKYNEVNELKKNKQFPTAILGDIEIQFLHYNSKEVALEKWNRRKVRMDFNNLFFKFDGQKDLANIELMRAFDHLDYNHKICISKSQTKEIKSNVFCPNWEQDGAKMFLKSIKHFNITKWLNSAL
jgi:uncharacterized protein (DUF1919 family)